MNITASSIMTLSIIGFISPLSFKYAELRILFRYAVMLSVIMLSVIMPRAMAPFEDVLTN